jgi:hypothetical protein
MTGKGLEALRSHYLGGDRCELSKARAKYAQRLMQGVSRVTPLPKHGYRCVTFHRTEKVAAPKVT